MNSLYLSGINTRSLRKKTLGLLFILCSVYAQAQNVTLSPQAEISVITCGRSSEELYAAFGHSAIHISDPVNRINYAYNYGVFDFDQPNFYLNFTRGHLLYKLGVYDYADFVNSYAYYNRWVTEQVLNLSPSQKQKLFEYLEWNALPENESYRYDYFYNNCANRVRDVIATVLGDSVRFDDRHITTSYTIRELTDLYLTDQPWGDLGIDICLGLPMDKKASPYEYMFLPDYILAAFDHAKILRDGVEQPLVTTKIPVFINMPQDAKRSLIHPWTVFGAFALLAITLSIWDWKRGKASLWFDVPVFGATGVVGILLTILWFATDHKAAANNFNLLWALPTNLAIVGVFASRARVRVKKYFLFVAGLSVLLLATWFILPQQLNVFLLPLVAALAIRAFVVARLLPS